MIGQAEAAVGGSQEVTNEQASSFAAYWQQFTQIWPSFLSLRGEITDHAARWTALAEDAYRAGDIEGFRALTYKADQVTQLENDRSVVEQTVTKFKDSWDTLWSYISSAGRWFGLGGTGGLGIAPLLLLVAVPTLIAAIAWVIQKYFEIRQGLDYDLTLLQAAEQGKLTAGQVQQLQRPAAARGADGGAISLPTALAIVGVGVLALVLMGGRR